MLSRPRFPDSVSQKKSRLDGTRGIRTPFRSKWLLSVHYQNPRHDFKQECMYLDDLGHTVREFAGRKRFQECSVDENVFWLPEGANEILAVRSVDSCLPAYARVDHGKQCCRNLTETYASHTLQSQKG